MVAVLVETLGRAVPVVVVPLGLGTPRTEVIQQRPGPHVPFAGLGGAVQGLAADEVPVHPPHDLVQHGTGSMSSRVVIRPAILLGTVRGNNSCQASRVACQPSVFTV